jgi:hypothetical protein
MGILAQTKGGDVEAIHKVCLGSIAGWKHYRNKRPGTVNYEAQVNEDLLGPLSELGDCILGLFEPEPSFLDRVATLVVLANSIQVFKLSVLNKSVTSINERRLFFAELTPAFVTLSLWYFRAELSSGESGFYNFTGFKDPWRRERFTVFLQLLDPAEVRLGSTTQKRSSADERALRTFARDVLAVGSFLLPEIFFSPNEPDPAVLTFGSGEDTA